jgi:tRNA G18 (ribose-2'-O)-methylase SpoU
MEGFHIGVNNVKYNTNVGTLMRSAYQLGASGVFTINKRYAKEKGDTFNVRKQIALTHHASLEEFHEDRPVGVPLVAIEKGGEPLSTFQHPERAIYILGDEDKGVPAEELAKCEYHISIEAARHPMYNVSVAGSIVMYHRYYQQLEKARDERRKRLGYVVVGALAAAMVCAFAVGARRRDAA